MPMEFKVNNRSLGDGHPSYIVAEMSGNHGGSLERALNIVRAAKRAGADAVKLQTYKASTITLQSNKSDFLLPSDSPWSASKTLYDLYEEAHTPWEWHEELFAEAKNIGIDIFSSPFDSTAVELLEKLDAPLYKIASPEITDIPLIKLVASTGKPVILSSGVADKNDLELAVETLIKGGCKQYAILKCTTAYPAPLEESNLRTMMSYKSDFDCLVGLSDHTLGFLAPLAAVSQGAHIVEKHFTITRDDKTVDSFFSMDEVEFLQMMSLIREAETCLGSATYEIAASAKNSMRGRRSLYVSETIEAGQLITDKNIKSVRPSFGLHPKYKETIIGRRAKVRLEPGDRLSLDLLE